MSEAVLTRRKRLAILVATVVLVSVFGTLTVTSLNRPPYEFISKFNGRRLPSNQAGELLYAFDSHREVLREAIMNEIGSKGDAVLPVANGDREDFVVVHTSAASSGRMGFPITKGEISMRQLPIYGTKKWVVIVARKETWLDQVWQKVRSWFGG